MDKIESLLVEINNRLDKINSIKEESRKRGEKFNIFNILGLSTNETRTHSAFLAELLNPDGNHGCGKLFLEDFLRLDPLKEVHFNTDDVHVMVEQNIGNKNEDATEGGRLDIVIQSSENMIIIENKIYASDQEKQLLRYDNYAKRCLSNGIIKNYSIIYLTLNGNEASNYSSAGTVDYICLSYQKDIIEWLQSCMFHALQKPLVRETIQQYISLLNQLTNQEMEQNEFNQIFEILAKYPNATAEIFHLGSTKYLEYVFDNYVIGKLQEFAQENSLIFSTSNLWNNSEWKSLYFYKKEWDHYAIIISNEHKNDFHGFFIGIASRNDIQDAEMIPESEKLNVFDKNPNKYWPYGWMWLKKYDNWWASTTIDMINGTFVKSLETDVLSVLKEITSKGLEMK